MAQLTTLAIASADIIARIKQRLAPIPATGAAQAAQVIWQDHGDTVLVHVDSSQARFAGGWLLCGLDLESDQTGRQNLQFLYYLGDNAASGTGTGALVNASAAGAAPLAERWGNAVLLTIHDAVLDAIEAAVYKVSLLQPNQTLTLGGYFATDSGLEVGVYAGAV